MFAFSSYRKIKILVIFDQVFYKPVIKLTKTAKHIAYVVRFQKNSGLNFHLSGSCFKVLGKYNFNNTESIVSLLEFGVLTINPPFHKRFNLYSIFVK